MLAGGALPGLHIGQSFMSRFPAGQRRPRLAVQRYFDVGPVPTSIVVGGDGADPAVPLSKLEAVLAADPASARSPPRRPDGAVVLIDAVTKLDPSTRTWRLSRNCATDSIPSAFAGSGAHVYVDGQAAWTADYFRAVNQLTPVTSPSCSDSASCC